MSEVDMSKIPEKYRPKERVLKSIARAAERAAAREEAMERFKDKYGTQEEKKEEIEELKSGSESPQEDDLLYPDWSKLTKIEAPQESSSGVFILEFSNESRLVIKSSTDLPTEYWTMELFSTLGLKVPRQRVLGYHQKEYKTLKSNVTARLSAEVRLKFYSAFQRPFIMVMEYIEGTGFFQLNRQTGPTSFNSVDSIGSYNLYDLGRVIGADVLINNFDRCPLVWENDGNGGNIMFGPQLTGIYAIDSKATCINDVDSCTKRNIENYFKKVDRLSAKCVEILQTIKNKGGIEHVDLNDVKFYSLEKVGNFLNMWTLSEVTPRSYCCLVVGMVSMWATILEQGKEIYCSGQEKALELHSENDWSNVWKDGLTLNMQFLNGIFDIIQLNLHSAQDELAYARELSKTITDSIV
mmetsp:Transcript_10041/g.10958  ORF Transcript_10041/g.10958 Transcript_10041/m.10958 type:complete len:410 (+) Transcript_10041:73-1302(+)